MGSWSFLECASGMGAIGFPKNSLFFFFCLHETRGLESAYIHEERA